MAIEFNSKELISKLNDLDKNLSKEIADEALTSGGNIVLESLKKEVHEKVYDTGELYKSLGLGKISGQREGRKIKIGSQSEKREIVERNYYNEYGTRFMVGKKHNEVAFKNSKKEAIKEIGNSLSKSLGDML